MINKFSNKYEFLSNFYLEDMVYDGETYPSSEHAYQALKTLNEEEREKIRNATTPGIAKKIGKEVSLRKDWEEIKDRIMYNIVREKFKHPVLRKKLIETGDQELIEGNTWGDTYWGVCNGKGQNKLGKILMMVRKDIMDRNSLREIAQENKDIVFKNLQIAKSFTYYDIQQAIIKTSVGTKIIYPEEIWHSKKPEVETEIEVCNEKTSVGASRLYFEIFDRYEDEYPTVLNFASAKKPGGGYLNGSKAQEEDLCRKSALYYSIVNQGQFYRERHKNAYNFRYNSNCFIYSPGVIFFRDENYEMLEEPFYANIISCAAPDNRNKDLDEKLVKEAYLERVDGILKCAMHMSDYLVLGAWGCGVFGNSPEMVADVFAELLNGKYKNVFKKIVFSVYDNTKHKKTFNAFKEKLGNEKQ